jgi:hypothetical protein
MATIRPIDMRLIEDAFGMASGYVLDFTNRSFAQFFQAELNVDIYHARYAIMGTSKANRLRVFLEVAPDMLAGKALRALWEYRDAAGVAPNSKEEKAQQDERFYRLVHGLDRQGGPPRPTPSQQPAPAAPALANLNARFLEITTLQLQARGFAFEGLLNTLFDIYKLDPRRSFRLVGEQIDGSFELPPDTYLLEAKWQVSPIGFQDLAAFAAKVEGKSQWASGLFISYNGFSPDGLQAFGRGRPTSIVCMDGLDLTHILTGALSRLDVFQRKKRRAVETGNCFVPVRELFFTVT